ncbi:DUF6731 family protein [Tenacibaculum aiptasiae]|uniref:DUF6731 family protein n=1 Tax=Tenacibaculum aiptasiae TaxID=426481 RepID=UPI003B5CFF9B
MSNTKDLSIYYYKITPKAITKEDRRLHQEELTKAFEIPNQENLENIIQTNGEVGLFEVKKRNDFTFGTFSFTQTESIPPRQNKNTKEINKLDLEEDDGLGYQTSFLFDSQTNIIVLVNRRPGVNAKSIEKFIKHNFNTPNFTLEKITNKSSMENFFKTKSYKKLKVKLASPTNINKLVDGSDLLPVEIPSLANKFEAGKLSFEFEAETKQSLNISKVREVVSYLDRQTSAELLTLTVTGNDPDVEEKTFNFLTGTINDKITVEKTRHNNFRTREVYEQLEIKFYENSIYLREVFSNK